MMPSEKKYIPGFDWFKIVGCVLVVAFHVGYFRYFATGFNSPHKIIYAVIPVFFIISGYLCGRNYSRERTVRQAIRYGIPYFVIEFGVVIVRFILIYIRTGRFSPFLFLVHILSCFIVSDSVYGWTLQLWFILMLVYALMINAFVPPGKRRYLIAVFVLLRMLLVLGDKSISQFFEQVLSAFPMIGQAFRVEKLAADMLKALDRFLTGVLFTTIGFEIVSWPARPGFYLLPALPFALFEAFVCRLNIASTLLAVALFFWVRQLPGQFLYPYHAQISVFSVIMFFSHMLEIRILRLFIDGKAVRFLLVIIINLVLTAVYGNVRRMKREAPSL